MIEHRQDAGLIVLSMDRKPCPCKDCSTRHMGCHGKCEKYQTWRAGVDSVIQEKIRQSSNNTWTATQVKTINHWFKWRNDWWKK